MTDEDELRAQYVVIKKSEHIAETYCYNKLRGGQRCLNRIPAYSKPLCSSCEAALKDEEASCKKKS
jgi:hypothetical protein